MATSAASGVDLEALLDLNRAHEVEISALDRRALDTLLDRAFYVGLLGKGGREALFIAFDHTAGNACPNSAGSGSATRISSTATA